MWFVVCVVDGFIGYVFDRIGLKGIGNVVIVCCY